MVNCDICGIAFRDHDRKKWKLDAECEINGATISVTKYLCTECMEKRGICASCKKSTNEHIPDPRAAALRWICIECHDPVNIFMVSQDC